MKAAVKKFIQKYCIVTCISILSALALILSGSVQLIALRILQLFSYSSALYQHAPIKLLLYVLQGIIIMYQVYETPQPLFDTFLFASFFIDLGIAYFFHKKHSATESWLDSLALSSTSLLMAALYGMLLGYDIQKDPITTAITSGIVYTFSWQAPTLYIAISSSFIVLSTIASIIALHLLHKDQNDYIIAKTLALISVYYGIIFLIDSATLSVIATSLSIALLLIGTKIRNSSFILYSTTLILIGGGLMSVDWIKNICISGSQDWVSIACASCNLLIFTCIRYHSKDVTDYTENII